MKTTFYILLAVLILFISYASLAQIRDSLIQLTPEIGDTITSSERNYYSLYPNIQGFEYATIFIRDDTIAVSKITYQNENGKYLDIIITNKVNYIGNLRAHIRQIDNTDIKDLKCINITTKDGEVIIGTLISIKRNEVVVIPDSGFDKAINDEHKNSITFTSEEISSVFVEGESYAFQSWLLGTVIGATQGGFIGLSTEDTYGQS